MISSMTGFGRGEAIEGNGTITVEVRSVNNRYLDVQIRSPRSLSALENRIRKAVQDRFARGRIDVFINRSSGDATSIRLVADHHLIGQYIEILNELKRRYSLTGKIELSFIHALPDVITRQETQEDLESVWTLLVKALDRAMLGLQTMREDEGRALTEDIIGRIHAIDSMIKSVHARVPEIVEAAQKRMNDSLARILKEPPEPARIAQEIAILAERTDVAEELTRLNSHLSQFRDLVAITTGEPVGRKLDFLIQEMGREVNTIASKAMDAEVSWSIVNVKAELEKVREQVQNIE
jgi:uncharacterized protein (TIGR00255 family)